MPIGVNEPILATKISGQGQGASIAALLPPGMRAAAVRINDVSGVAGFVQPNDSVDVLITRTMPGAANNTQLTDVLIQNVRVIAIDQQAQRRWVAACRQDRNPRSHANRRAEARARAGDRKPQPGAAQARRGE